MAFEGVETVRGGTGEKQENSPQEPVIKRATHLPLTKCHLSRRQIDLSQGCSISG